MARDKHDPAAVDAYLASLPEAVRATFGDLRELIRAAVPGVQERVSYGTAVIFARHHDLVGFVAQPKHLSFLTMSPELARTMKPEITRTHKVSGATIHFSADHPLPPQLVERIVAARLAEQDSPPA